MSDVLQKIRIVLVNPSHPGNIGAVARAMKTMGLQRLYLVQPKAFPDPEAVARAKQADDILTNAVVVNNLLEAVADCCLIVGASARPRNLAWPTLNLVDAKQKIIEEACTNQTAIIFGRERTGLTNEEIQMCHYRLNIPANPHYSSLNLAAAVQIVAYEIYQYYLAQANLLLASEQTDLANMVELNGLYQHLATVLTEVGYLDPEQPGQIMPRLQRLFNRARLDKTEINILRGILNAAQKKFKTH